MGDTDPFQPGQSPSPNLTAADHRLPSYRGMTTRRFRIREMGMTMTVRRKSHERTSNRGRVHRLIDTTEEAIRNIAARRTKSVQVTEIPELSVAATGLTFGKPRSQRSDLASEQLFFDPPQSRLGRATRSPHVLAHICMNLVASGCDPK